MHPGISFASNYAKHPPSLSDSQCCAAMDSLDESLASVALFSSLNGNQARDQEAWDVPLGSRDRVHRSRLMQANAIESADCFSGSPVERSTAAGYVPNCQVLGPPFKRSCVGLKRELPSRHSVLLSSSVTQVMKKTRKLPAFFEDGRGIKLNVIPFANPAQVSVRTEPCRPRKEDLTTTCCLF